MLQSIWPSLGRQSSVCATALTKYVMVPKHPDGALS